MYCLFINIYIPITYTCWGRGILNCKDESRSLLNFDNGLKCPDLTHSKKYLPIIMPHSGCVPETPLCSIG